MKSLQFLSRKKNRKKSQEDRSQNNLYIYIYRNKCSWLVFNKYSLLPLQIILFKVKIAFILTIPLKKTKADDATARDFHFLYLVNKFRLIHIYALKTKTINLTVFSQSSKKCHLERTSTA